MPARIQHVEAEPALPVINGWFVTSDRTRIELRERKKFHDAYGNVAFRVHASWMTLSDRIVVADSQGAVIGHVRRKQRTVCLFASGSRTTYYFGTPNNDTMGSVKAKGTTTCPSVCDADIYLGDTWIGETMGSWFTKSIEIYIGGVRVAGVLRTDKTAEGGFGIIVAEGVDASFVLMVVMALGEIHGWADMYAGGLSSTILSESIDRGIRSDEPVFYAQNFRGRLG